MSPLELGVLIFVVLALPFAIIVAILLWLRRNVHQTQDAIANRFPTAVKIIPSASFFGQESKGVMQMRGTGTLVLTTTSLYFQKWVVGTEYTINLSQIRAIETPTSFLGKTQFKPLLKLVYQTDSGQQDAMAWLVPDFEELKKMIEDRIQL
ncbi:MAG: hypothetical protein RLP44_00270 [Aggregatilineales bacterium]